MRSILPIPSSAWQHGRMGHEHRYQATITWTGNLGEGTVGYRSYSRDHEVSGKGKPVLPGSSDPAFRGDPKRWNPEELLVAALSQCHMLWFLNLCAANGIVVISYTDDAQGTMAEGADGGGEFTAVTLRPRAAIADSGQAVGLPPTFNTITLSWNLRVAGSRSRTISAPITLW
jgi:organic hydroperoxide reductase OsmC/OhrA